MWTVSANIYCINQETGEKNFIFKNMRCNGIGKVYSSLAECQSQEPAASADADYVGEYYGDCKDANTSPLGSTSADTNKCTR